MLPRSIPSIANLPLYGGSRGRGRRSWGSSQGLAQERQAGGKGRGDGKSGMLDGTLGWLQGFGYSVRRCWTESKALLWRVGHAASCCFCTGHGIRSSRERVGVLLDYYCYVSGYNFTNHIHRQGRVGWGLVWAWVGVRRGGIWWGSYDSFNLHVSDYMYIHELVLFC